MKLAVFPPLDDQRLARVREAAGAMSVVNAADEPQALAEIVEADAFFGKITPALLARARKLAWVQSPTASLEHYLFPELIEHPCVLSNMRGLFSDVIADHVLGFIICFARHFHTYFARQMRREWEAVGGEAGRSTFTAGPGLASSIDLSHRHLADCTLGVVGAGEIVREVLRRGQALGMTLLAVDPSAASVPGVERVWPPSRLDDLLAAADFVVIAAPHTPETYKLFRRRELEHMK